MSSDRYARPLHDLRISVTDRCNFRCAYCMPKEIFGRDFAFLERDALLTFEEMTRLARAFVANGVEKLRLTGGEPLLRRDLERLVSMLASLDGVRDIALTTNGSLLTRAKAHALRDAGLRRITISLDALDDALFRRINDVDFSVTRVLDAIDAAAEVGMSPIKIDMVVRRGMNDTSVVAMARRFRGTGHIVRFIEFMDVGNTNGWRLEDVVPGREIVETLSREWPLEPVDAQYFGEVAERWRYVDGGGEIGVITSVTQPFCGTCTRARLTASGELFTCLFSGNGHDLRALVRSGASDEELAAAVAKVWRARDDRYSEIRSEATVGLRRVEMSRIGG
ncbi:MAG: 3,8-cyclase [Acidobacteriota bacterium]|jgi:cyclic pyranopterin phosphate synthase|nr:3,8-cyclase [Acidobacteriota bacterium]